VSRILFCLALILSASAAFGAQTVFERYLAERGGTAPCFARDAGASDGRGRIDRFFLANARPVGPRPRDHFEVAFGYTLKGSPEIFASKADCDVVGELARCDVADDAGRFTLSPEGDHPKLIIGNRLSLEGQHGYGPDLADGDDDLVVQLHPAPPEACATEAPTQ
jgi:hypothetical protein